MTVSLGVKGYADHLIQFSSLRRKDVYVILARNYAVLHLCVYVFL